MLTAQKSRKHANVPAPAAANPDTPAMACSAWPHAGPRKPANANTECSMPIRVPLYAAGTEPVERDVSVVPMGNWKRANKNARPTKVGLASAGVKRGSPGWKSAA